MMQAGHGLELHQPLPCLVVSSNYQLIYSLGSMNTLSLIIVHIPVKLATLMHITSDTHECNGPCSALRLHAVVIVVNQ